MLVYFWLSFVFILRATVGSFLNVVVARLPLEKSILWPGSRCGKCLAAIRWYDNIPLFSYLWLHGRCRSCGQQFSSRYFFVELVCTLGFAGLFYAEVIVNIHGWPGVFRQGILPSSWWVGFVYHAVLFALLLAAALCDLACREIPLGITIPGTIIGFVGASFCPGHGPARPRMPLPLFPPELIPPGSG